MTYDPLDPHEVTDLAEEYALGKVTSVTSALSAWSRRGNHQDQPSPRRDARKGDRALRRGEGRTRREAGDRSPALPAQASASRARSRSPTAKGRHYRDARGACMIVCKAHRREASERRPADARADREHRSFALRPYVLGKGYKKGIDNRFSFERRRPLQRDPRPAAELASRRSRARSTKRSSISAAPPRRCCPRA